MEEVYFLIPFRSLNLDFSGPIDFGDYRVSSRDKKILKELAREKAEIAGFEIHDEKRKMWKKLNGLEKARPLVWINDIPWHELNVDDELTNKTTSAFAGFLETRLRRNIYQWKHMPGDMVVEPKLPCYKVVDETGFGLHDTTEKLCRDEHSDIISHHYKPQLKTEKDIEKIKDPEVTYDEVSTEKMYAVMKELFDGILEVELKSIPGLSLSIWDDLIQFYGVQEALTDLALRPVHMHRVLKRYTEAKMKLVDAYEEKGLLELNNGNYRVGSGGLSFTDELPRGHYRPDHVRAIDTWGYGTAQIFDSVSPEMHEEFAVQYEIPLMEKFGLNYYGCCEPLHKKIDIIRKLPRVRKISMSPWSDLEEGAEKIGRDYVFSWKPNPSIFVGDNWDRDKVRRDLRENLVKIKGCNIEIIMKDISTVSYKPQRLWEWARIAMEEAEGLN